MTLSRHIKLLIITNFLDQKSIGYELPKRREGWSKKISFVKAERSLHGENLSYCLQGCLKGGGGELLCRLYNPKVNSRRERESATLTASLSLARLVANQLPNFFSWLYQNGSD